MTNAWTWFDITEDVWVKASPERLREAAGTWGEVLNHAGQLIQELDRASQNLTYSWTGPAADAYRAHLKQLSDMLHQADTDYRPCQHTLEQGAQDIDTARRRIEIPTHMYPEVKNFQYIWFAGGVGAALPMYAASYDGDVAYGEATQTPEHAQTALNNLNDANGKNTGTLNPSDVSQDRSHGDPNADNKKMPPGGAKSGIGGAGGGGVPGGGLGGGLPGPHVGGPNADDPFPPGGGGNPTTDPWGGPGAVGGGRMQDPSWWNNPDGGSGLAGAGDGLAGAVGGGLDGGGIGAGGGIGGGVGTGDGLHGAGTGSGAGLDGGYSSRATAAGRGGMMGAGGGHGAGGGEGDEHQTWLTEDEDVWGANRDDLPPPVLGKGDW